MRGIHTYHKSRSWIAFVRAQGFEYTRCGNPIRSVLEKCLVALDNAKYALAYSSGMTAISSVVNLLAPGEHVLCSSNVYGGTYRFLSEMANHAGIMSDFVDFSVTDNIVNNIKPNTKASDNGNRSIVRRTYFPFSYPSRGQMYKNTCQLNANWF